MYYILCKAVKLLLKRLNKHIEFSKISGQKFRWSTSSKLKPQFSFTKTHKVEENKFGPSGMLKHNPSGDKGKWPQKKRLTNSSKFKPQFTFT